MAAAASLAAPASSEQRRLQAGLGYYQHWVRTGAGSGGIGTTIASMHSLLSLYMTLLQPFPCLTTVASAVNAVWQLFPAGGGSGDESLPRCCLALCSLWLPSLAAVCGSVDETFTTSQADTSSSSGLVQRSTLPALNICCQIPCPKL